MPTEARMQCACSSRARSDPSSTHLHGAVAIRHRALRRRRSKSWNDMALRQLHDWWLWREACLVVRHAMLRAPALIMSLCGSRSAVAPAVARGADIVLSDIARVCEPRRYSREQPLAWQSGADTSSLSPGAQACWWPALRSARSVCVA